MTNGLASSWTAKARAWLERTKSRPFVRGVAALMGGTAGRQLIVLIAAPLLTRLYTPNDFGVLTVFTSALSIGTVVCSLTYHLAIPLPDEDESAANLLALALLLAVAISAIAGAAAWYWRFAAAEWLQLPALSNVAWMFGLALVGAGAYQALSYWASRQKHFGLLARTKIAQGIGQDSTQVVAGLGGFGPSGLVGGYVIGKVLGTEALLRRGGVPWRAVRWASLRRAAREYIAFPLYSSWAGLANVVGLQLPPVLIAHAFGGDISGLFGFTTRVLAMPTMLLGQACAQVFYPTAARRANNPAEFGRLTEHLATALLVVGLVAFVPLAMAGPEMFRVIFGGRWMESGEYARLMAPWAVASLVSSPLSGVLLIRKRQRLALVLTLYEAALRIGCVEFGAYLGSVRVTVALLTGAGIVISAVSVGWAFHLSRASVWHWLAGRVRILVVAALVLAVAGLARPYVNMLLLAAAATVVLGVVAWKTELRVLVT